MRMIVGISGASGVIYGIRLLEVLASVADIETHLVLTPSGRLNIGIETDRSTSDVESLADVVHNIKNMAAPIASGSYPTMGMVVAPCSMKTLSAVVNAYSDNLLSRAAEVTLKEGRPLVLMPRESPLHAGHARLLHEATLMGIHVAPPMPAFYNSPQTVDDIINHSGGRVLRPLRHRPRHRAPLVGPAPPPRPLTTPIAATAHGGVRTLNSRARCVPASTAPGVAPAIEHLMDYSVN